MRSSKTIHLDEDVWRTLYLKKIKDGKKSINNVIKAMLDEEKQ